MSLILSSMPGGAQVTVFFFVPLLLRPLLCACACPCAWFCGGVSDVDGGVLTAGESRLVLRPIDFSASSNGFTEDGCATFDGAPGFAGVCAGGAGGAFLKVGNLGLGFGAEKNDESDFASFDDVDLMLAPSTPATPGSLFTTVGLEEDATLLPKAVFFAAGGVGRDV